MFHKHLICNTVAESDGSNWLAVEENKGALTVLRRNIEKGLPVEVILYIEKLEKHSNKSWRYRPQGRPIVNKG